MSAIVQAVLTLSLLGFAFGLLLAWVSKKFHVEVDPRVARITEILPGVNCGACGTGGCASFAEALVCKEIDLNSCTVCHSEDKKKIAEILGIAAEDLEKKTKLVACIACGGGDKAKDKFKYQGLNDCRSAALTMGGGKLCQYACLGLGTCAEACPVDAIEMLKQGIPRVIAERCISCKKCVLACPRDIVFMLDNKKSVYIKCSSHDKGPQVVKKCKVGCIACGKCVKACPVKAIQIINNLAVIDHNKCINCKKCVEVCPTKAIAVR